MGEIATKPKEWADTVNKGNKSVNDVKKFEIIHMSRTDLKPFAEISEMLNKVNSSISKFKEYSDTETSKMIQASKNKEKDDETYASQKGFGNQMIAGFGPSGPIYQNIPTRK